ncbi:MAG TPA: hypothetical protein VFJ96_07720, partial [Gemmatimonadaceae bacterium]|nr:hypothetical protein [Gemmatimonadaceae bacterium]
AIQRARDCFSWINVARAIARLYEDLLTPRRRRVTRELTTSTLFSERLVPLMVQQDADVPVVDPDVSRARRAARRADAPADLVDAEHESPGHDHLDDFELTA